VLSAAERSGQCPQRNAVPTAAELESGGAFPLSETSVGNAAPRLRGDVARAGTGVRLQLLRGFSLWSDGSRLEVPFAVQRLVAFLALQERRVHRLALAGTLWIDSSEDHAGASLRTALWRLGQVADGIVTIDGTTLALSRDVAVDLRHAVSRANLLLERPEEHADHDVELLGIAGDLLPDWYDDWVLVERERFRQLRLHALETLCHAFAAVGAHMEAVRAGLAAVAVEPLRESSHRALISAYIAEGNPSEALRHYELYKRQLTEALELHPSARMEMMIARIRSA
jgi:DNA-binding SARP family transcriptional activator